MIEGPEKKVLIIAGPNGAGKTTFAREFLPVEAQCPVFINAKDSYRPVLDAWQVLDYSGEEPILIEESQ